MANLFRNNNNKVREKYNTNLWIKLINKEAGTILATTKLIIVR
jgi:hypothetical protein